MTRLAVPRVEFADGVLNRFAFFDVDTTYPAQLLEEARVSSKDIGRFTLSFVHPRPNRPKTRGWYNIEEDSDRINIVCSNLVSPIIRPGSPYTFERTIVHELGHYLDWKEHSSSIRLFRDKQSREDSARAFEKLYSPMPGTIVQYKLKPEFDPAHTVEVYDCSTDFVYDWQTSDLAIR